MKSKAPNRVASTAGRNRAVARDHDDRKSGIRLLDPGEDLEPIHARHLDVEENGVGTIALEPIQSRLRRMTPRKKRTPRTRGSS
jgi:hypothetical protein